MRRHVERFDVVYAKVPYLTFACREKCLRKQFGAAPLQVTIRPTFRPSSLCYMQTPL